MSEIQESVVGLVPFLLPVVNDLGEADAIAQKIPEIVEVAELLYIIGYWL